MVPENEKRKKESYTSLSLIKECPYKYKLHYVDGNYKNVEAIALSVGTLCHKILELQRKPPYPNQYSFEDLYNILMNGYEDENEKIDGINVIKEKFFEDYMLTNPKSNLNYTQKIDIFINYIKSYKPDKEWLTVATELPFAIRYQDFELNGKIDRLDINVNTGAFKVVDYKTANTVYKDSELKTPMQMYVYALAIKDMFGRYPEKFEYDFVVLGEKREAMSKGWESRGKKMLDKLVDDRNAYYESKEFPPHPTPLCWWCDYRNEECEYFSLWQPTSKTFAVNKQYEPFTQTQNQGFVW